MRRSMCFLAAVFFAMGLPQSRALADKPPSPQTALKRAARELARLDGFEVAVSAQGGTAASPDKIRCDKTLVRRTYRMRVRRPLARIDSPEAFWVYGRFKGALRLKNGSRWVKILADPKGKEVPHLARAVETVLAEAARHARRHGRWLDEGEDTQRWRAADEERKEAGHTNARNGGDDAERVGAATLPTTLRVIGPWQLAERLIVEVQNSGCLSGG